MNEKTGNVCVAFVPSRDKICTEDPLYLTSIGQLDDDQRYDVSALIGSNALIYYGRKRDEILPSLPPFPLDVVYVSPSQFFRGRARWQ